MFQRVREATLPERDAAQLEMSVSLAWVDCHGILEALNSLRVLTALLVDQSKLILRVTIVWIDRRRLERPAEVLPAMHACTETHQLPAEKEGNKKQDEWRANAT